MPRSPGPRRKPWQIYNEKNLGKIWTQMVLEKAWSESARLWLSEIQFLLQLPMQSLHRHRHFAGDELEWPLFHWKESVWQHQDGQMGHLNQDIWMHHLSMETLIQVQIHLVSGQNFLHSNCTRWEHKPVSMLSFTMQSPDSRRQSQGTSFRDGSENSKTSPGTNSWEGTDLPGHNVRYKIKVQCQNAFLGQGVLLLGLRRRQEGKKEEGQERGGTHLQKPFLSTRTSHSKRDISLSRRIVCVFCEQS